MTGNFQWSSTRHYITRWQRHRWTLGLVKFVKSPKCTKVGCELAPVGFRDRRGDKIASLETMYEKALALASMRAVVSIWLGLLEWPWRGALLGNIRVRKASMQWAAAQGYFKFTCAWSKKNEFCRLLGKKYSSPWSMWVSLGPRKNLRSPELEKTWAQAAQMGVRSYI